MTTTPLRTITPALDVYIKLAQYPVLADEIRERMRREMFQRGIVNQIDFEREVRQKSIESQRREGLLDPFSQEQANMWQKRQERVRDYLTDAYFANNLGSSFLEQLIEEARGSRPAPIDNLDLTFNPELAPWEMLFRQGEIYENLPPNERQKVNHHLEEIKVVLIKGMISDQLPFIGVAKKVFQIADLRYIYQHRIGSGKIGGKSAGMMLAWKILQQQDPDVGADISQWVDIPESYYIGTEVIYEFRLKNKMDYVMNQKYRPLEEIRQEYPSIVEAHLRGEFPENIVAQLNHVLDAMGDDPIIVRSSSLLEDNFGFSFAGKYNSYFCPNQGTHEENLHDLLNAIRRVYASSLNPDAILYRIRNGLLDYDERMAILIQRLRGQRYGRYYLPSVAGVGFSQNPFRWNPKIRREDGFLRIVWGLGTRAVDRVDKDYPRTIALSHPRLRPETTARAIRQYSQWYVDVIDLQENAFKTFPIQEILQPDYPDLRFLISLDKGDYLQEVFALGANDSSDQFVLTFNNLVKDGKFIKLIRTALARLEKAYGTPVDTEFTIEIVHNYPYPDYKLHMLQCRPLSMHSDIGKITIPNDVPQADVLFRAHDLIPDGKVEGVRYLVFVDPEKYRQIPSLEIKLELGRVVSRLNKRLEGEIFILMGPGRWGSTNLELGVKVSYADIYNTKALVEIGVAKDGAAPELSYGTHFFQDLVESGIYSLPLHLTDAKNYFNWDFFRNSWNCLAELLPQDGGVGEYLRVIDVTAVANGRRLNILMDGNSDEALGYLLAGQWQISSEDHLSMPSFG